MFLNLCSGGNFLGPRVKKTIEITRFHRVYTHSCSIYPQILRGCKRPVQKCTLKVINGVVMKNNTARNVENSLNFGILRSRTYNKRGKHAKR